MPLDAENDGLEVTPSAAGWPRDARDMRNEDDVMTSPPAEKLLSVSL